MFYNPSVQKPGCELQGGACTELHCIPFRSTTFHKKQNS